MHKSVTILGATGSIGQSTLDIVRRNPDAFSIVGVTAQNSVEELAKIALEFNAAYAAIGNEEHFIKLKDLLAGSKTKVLAGESGIEETAQANSDIVMAAIVGAAGLKPTFKAVERGATVALANKECLVCAGDLMSDLVQKSGATLLPVDSEHNAIFQVFNTKQADMIRKVILTASGGPFLDRDLATLSSVTPAEAVAHPNWDMGAKISVDSATMMNKGLEVIEAFHLFPVSADQIEVVIHPQSVIHSLVDYKDGSVLAQLGSPDMRTPIAYALAWPQRMAAPSKPLSLSEIGQLTFIEPDLEKFRCLGLAMQALRAGGSAPVVLNTANEIAVELFLDKALRFTDIAGLVEETLSVADMKAPHSLENLVAMDKEIRVLAYSLASKKFRMSA